MTFAAELLSATPKVSALLSCPPCVLVSSIRSFGSRILEKSKFCKFSTAGKRKRNNSLITSLKRDIISDVWVMIQLCGKASAHHPNSNMDSSFYGKPMQIMNTDSWPVTNRNDSQYWGQLLDWCQLSPSSMAPLSSVSPCWRSVASPRSSSPLCGVSFSITVS